MSIVTHLRSIAITAADLPSLLPFYEQTWGLQQVGVGTDGSILLRANGPEHHVLTLAPGSGHRLERISLGGRDRGAIDALAVRLHELGSSVLSDPQEREEFIGGGYGVTFLDPEGRTVEVATDVTAHAVTDRGWGPDRLSHIVLNATDMSASTAFYTEVLGFTVSDRYENDQMIFLRCNELHHCIVLAPGEWTSLNHVAFEVRSGDEVMRSLGRMRKAGFDTVWGPGRHGPGGNVFAYFIDPVGNVIEYTAELLEVGDDWVPQSWARTAENADVWGTSGGITPEVIRAMANPPSGLHR